MKKTALLILIMSISSIVGQERNTKPKAVIGETLGKLSKAKGWILNPQEEWVSLDNTIPEYIDTEFNSLLSHEQTGLGCDNFLYYELRNLTYKDQEYFILIKKYRSGFYSYPSIQEDWKNTISYKAYVFRKSEWHKIDTMIDSKINLFKIELAAEVNIDRKPQSGLYSLITSKMKWNLPYEEKSTLYLHVAPYKEKNVVQFQIYTTSGKYNFIGGILKEHKGKKTVANVTMQLKDIYLTEELFDNCYFETDYTSFDKFIRLN